VTLRDVAKAAAILLDMVDERIGGADVDWVSHDHAGAEAAIIAAACLESAALADSEGDTADVAGCLKVLELSARILGELPLPTGQNEILRRLRSALEAGGNSPPPGIRHLLLAA